MFGTFQQSHLRIEVQATAAQLSRSLLQPESFRQWLAPQQFSGSLPRQLETGSQYGSHLGPVQVAHRVEWADGQQLKLILNGAIDGFHHWQWGDGWVQSRLEGISLLPLALAHSASLVRLQQHLKAQA
jgi:hypothetical protein